MEIGERIEEDDDRKPSARPQHLETTVIAVMDGAETESGITMEGGGGICMSTAISESLSSGTLKRCGSSFNSEKTFKRVKSEVVTCRSLDGFIAPHAQASRSHLVQKTPTPAANRLDADAARDDGATMDAVTQEMPVSSDSNRPEDSTAAIHLATESDSSLSTPSIQLPPNPRSEVTTSIKATHFRHLKQMYLSELEYMLREFEKLERQLLGAKTASGSAAAESAASRERREKLHSFIQHLEDTIQQIVTGVELETAGQPTCPTRLDGDTGLSAHLSQEKEEEENVQKIEEHILANLLPVKVRLKKQLAAQQGAKHNPAGMPPVRGGGMMMMQTDAAKQGKATFLKAVPERRPSQFGKALNGGGSNLTQKLHGPTLGSADRCHGHGVGQDNGPVVEPVPSLAEEKGKSKVLYAGLALGSKQILSSVTAARSVHKLSIQDPVLLKVENELHSMVHKTSSSSPTSIDLEDLKLASSSPLQLDDIAASDDDDDAEPDHIYSKHGTQLSLAAQAAIVSYEERRKVRKMRRKKKKLLLQQQQEKAAAAVAALPKRKKIVKKRGPRNVEYMCALCNEIYNSTCDYNPWWALSQHDCPKCGKMQIPRIDIGATANAIEYHPALLAHADENGAGTPEAVVLTPPPSQLKASPPLATDTDDLLESDLSDDDGLLSDDDSFDSSYACSDDIPAVTLADQAENEKFGLEYEGPMLPAKHASRLLTLMLHANTCPCRHVNADHLEVCRSVKWMMLHVRDCPGTTPVFDICPFPWCRKVKHLMYHVVACTEPKECAICSTKHLNTNMIRLRGMNIRRGEKHQAALIAKTVAATDTLNVKPRAAAQTKPLAVKPVQALTAKRTASSVEAGLNDTVVIIGTDENSGEASPVKMEDLQFAPTDMQPQQFMNPQPDVAVKVESSAAVAPIQGSTTDVSFTNLLPSATVAPSIDLPSLSTASAEVTAQQQPNAPAEEVLSSMSEALAASKLVGEGFHSPNVFPASLVAVKSEDGVTRNSAVANVETLTLYRSTVASVADGNASTESPQSLVKNGEVPVIAALPCIKVEDDSNVIIIWEESV